MGKSQFEIVAAASMDFDMYMKETLGAIDAELARREETRHDRFGDYPQSHVSPKGKDKIFNQRKRNMKDPESDDIDSSGTSEDGSDADEGGDDDGGNYIIWPRQSKTTSSQALKGETAPSEFEADGNDFKQWKKYQAMIKKQHGQS